jgi:hypothetical protein
MGLYIIIDGGAVMIQGALQYSFFLRTGFFRLVPYTMSVLSDGIRLYQVNDGIVIQEIFIPDLELQKVIIYRGKIPELELITPREVFIGPMREKVSIEKLHHDLTCFFGSRVMIH